MWTAFRDKFLWKYEKEVWYIHVKHLSACLDDVHFRRMRDLLPMRPFAQNFEWKTPWYDFKHPYLHVLQEHPTGKFPEFPWSILELIMTDFSRDNTEDKDLLVYFDADKHNHLTRMCPSLRQHFTKHIITTLLPQ